MFLVDKTLRMELVNLIGVYVSERNIQLQIDACYNIEIVKWRNETEHVQYMYSPVCELGEICVVTCPERYSNVHVEVCKSWQLWNCGESESSFKKRLDIRKYMRL